MAYRTVVVLLIVLQVCGLTYGDCYPGDTQFTAIVQGIYRKVTSNRISGLRGYSNPLTRSQLCRLLVDNHNFGKHRTSGQVSTNRQFLGQSISQSSCVNALNNTRGYSTQNEWNKWTGHYHGTWWNSQRSFSDGARRYQPYLRYVSGQTYAVQKIEFKSQWRRTHCTRIDQLTRATCRFGWTQSGNGVIMVLHMHVQLCTYCICLLYR